RAVRAGEQKRRPSRAVVARRIELISLQRDRTHVDFALHVEAVRDRRSARVPQIGREVAHARLEVRLPAEVHECRHRDQAQHAESARHNEHLDERETTGGTLEAASHSRSSYAAGMPRLWLRLKLLVTRGLRWVGRNRATAYDA